MVFKSLFKPQFVVIQFEVRQAVPDYRQGKKCKFFYLVRAGYSYSYGGLGLHFSGYLRSRHYVMMVVIV